MSPPNPGSDEALALGCKCPVIDNGRGKGYMGQPGMFVRMGNCPLHGWDSADMVLGAHEILKEVPQ